MTKADLVKRLKLNEWEDFEAKLAAREVPQDVWKTVSAFANTEGGYIVFGVRDLGEGQFEIAGVEDVEKIQNDFLTVLRGDKFNLQLSSKGHLLDFDGRRVLAFRIDSMPRNCKPIYYGGDIRNTFMRQGSGDYKCSQEEIQRMLREASEFSSDSMILEDFGLNDIDVETIQIYRRFLAVRSPESPFLILNDEELLIKLGCVIKEGFDPKIRLTMGGLLLFGKTDSIRRRFPAYELDIYLIRSRDIDALSYRWDDRKIYEDNLITTYLQGMEYLKSKIEIPFALADDHITRTEDVPMVIALREAFVNMLIHRDYFDNAQSRIRLELKQIEMYNPGSAPKSVEDIIENAVTAPRNPIIAKAFRLLGWAEIAGSGMMKIFTAWERLDYQKPVIDNNTRGHYFKMVFPLEESNEKAGDRPSADQVPTKYRPSKELSEESRLIIKYCLTPHSLKEIMNHMGLRHRQTFLPNYIKPLLERGFLELTIPEKPNSPNQKYRTTEKGRQLLKS